MWKYLLLAGLGLGFAIGTAVAESSDEEDDGPANDVEVIMPPAPDYPLLANLFGIEGYCEVRFNLIAGGKYVHVETAACTHPIFCEEAQNAIIRAQFRVIDVPGAKYPGERRNIVYPLSFQFEEGDRHWSTPVPCTADLVS